MIKYEPVKTVNKSPQMHEKWQKATNNFYGQRITGVYNPKKYTPGPPARQTQMFQPQTTFGRTIEPSVGHPGLCLADQTHPSVGNSYCLPIEYNCIYYTMFRGKSCRKANRLGEDSLKPFGGGTIVTTTRIYNREFPIPWGYYPDCLLSHVSTWQRDIDV